jgi:ABC-2 type transport system ATP-binding protein
VAPGPHLAVRAGDRLQRHPSGDPGDGFVAADRLSGRRPQDELADQVAVLDHGRLIAEGAPETLKRRVPGGHVRLQFADQEGLESAARALGASARALGASARDDDALTLEVPSDGGVRSLRGLLDQLDGASVEVDSLSVHLPDLDDVFLALTGQPDKERATLP